MQGFFTPPRLRVISSLLTNLAAGWMGAIVIAPNYADLGTLEDKLLLLADVGLAILCIYIAFTIEETLTHA